MRGILCSVSGSPGGSTSGPTPPADSAESGPPQPGGGSVARRLNWLRAGVLGAMDGIIATDGLVVGIAAATTDGGAIATAGVAALVAGAASMALGEFVSVSSQRDSERALIELERRALEQMPEDQHAELVQLLEQRGLPTDHAVVVADDLTQGDVLGAHLALEFGIDRGQLASPWAAAGSSAIAFSLGAALPLVAVLSAGTSIRIPVTFTAVLVGLFVTGWVSASLGYAPKRRAIVRLVGGGALAMAVTYGVGHLIGAATG